ncbi:MAG TPA: hypothetical protein DHV17_06280 [Chitinophagaceae bacterium]|nr:hypothetical protein [Chitinophagaceae bacterium]
MANGFGPILFHMSRFHSYLQTATRLIRQHQAPEPFAVYLKKAFALDRKFGSLDRKIISSICYSYFRCAGYMHAQPTEENFLKAMFACGEDGHGLMASLSPVLFEQLAVSADERLSILDWDAGQLFPCREEIGALADKEAFVRAMLQQPLLFIRIRPGRHAFVKQALTSAGINYSELSGDCLALPPATKLESYVTINRDAVVQDWASQQSLGWLALNRGMLGSQRPLPVWDCCAASGGKSILLYDILDKQVRITVSDIRKSVLSNCRRRLQEAGVNVDRFVQADLSQAVDMIDGQRWPLIIADLPCTGSGTWARTPDQAYYFILSQLDEYVSRQSAIIRQVMRKLEPGGICVYITCSVFAKENEGQVKNLVRDYPVTVLHQQYIEGAAQQADTMFVAILQKSS